MDEVLFWVAFQRLPLEADSADNLEIQEFAGIDMLGEMHRYLWDDETERAGIPPDPRLTFAKAGNVHIPVELYDKLLANEHLEPELRRQRSLERDAILALERDFALWRPHYERATEYPRSRIFVVLKEGTLLGLGRKSTASTKVRSIKALRAKSRRIARNPLTAIDPSFWTLKGIEFESSAASNSPDHYRDISFLTEDVLKVFPGDGKEVSGVERIGISLILNEKPLRSQLTNIRRGRPSFPWESFHLEVADLIRRSEMPHKKEAAIEHFQEWFERQHGFRPSRAAVGEKLKPYFDKFIKTAGQKI